MNMRHLLIFVVAAFVFASCKSTTTPEVTASADPTTIRQLYPHAYGVYWIRDVKLFDTIANVTLEASKTLEVIDTERRHGAISYIIDDGSPSYREGFFYSDSDLYSFDALDTTHNAYGLYLHFPM